MAGENDNSKDREHLLSEFLAESEGGISRENLRQYMDGELGPDEINKIRFELAKRPALREKLRLVERRRELENEAALKELGVPVLVKTSNALLSELGKAWQKIVGVLAGDSEADSPRSPAESILMNLLGLRPSGAALSSAQEIPRVEGDDGVLFVDEAEGDELVLGVSHQDLVGREVFLRIGAVQLVGICKAYGSERSRVSFPWGERERDALRESGRALKLEISIDAT